MSTFLEFLEKGILFDSHCHLNASHYIGKIKDVIDRLGDVDIVIDMSTDINSSIDSISLSKKYKGQVYSAIGIDPEVFIPGSELFQQNLDIDKSIEIIENLISENKQYVAMIGETGMDNYWLHKMKEGEIEKPKGQEVFIEDSIDRQKLLFEKHIQLSQKFDLPMSIHSRGTIDECIEILSTKKASGVFHSLTNDYPEEKDFYDQVNKILELGFYIGVNGIVTYKSAELIRSVFRKIYNEKQQIPKPKSQTNGNQGRERNQFLESLYEVGFVLETDGPYLVPSNFEPFEKRLNEPAAVSSILDYLYGYFSS